MVKYTLEKMFYVYVLKSEKDQNLYIGFTKDLRQRIEYHNLGLNKSTACRRPLKLIYYECYLSEKDARRREKFLKSGRGHEILYKQITECLKSIHGGVSSTG